VKRATRILIPIMILLVSTMLAGCGGSPDKTVAKFLGAFKAMDSSKMSKYVVWRRRILDCCGIPERLEKQSALVDAAGQDDLQGSETSGQAMIRPLCLR